MVRLKGKKKDQDQSMGDLVIASSDEEEEQEEAGAGGGEPEPQNAEEVVRVIADEDGQVELEQPVRYMAIGNTTLSLTSAKDSESIADLKKMEVIIVTHTKTVDDKLRLRTRRGWGSAIRSSDSTTLMIAANSSSEYFRAKDDTNVRVESDKKSDKAEAPLKKGRVIEALETAEDDGRKFIKFTNGWVSEVSVKGGKTTKLVEPIRFKDPGNLERKGMIKKISPAVKGIESIVADLRAYPFEMSSEATALLTEAKDVLESDLARAEKLVAGADKAEGAVGDDE